MQVNYSSISGQVVEYGYTGAYTGGGISYDYQLTSHGEAHPNSIMAEANFATTGTVEIGVVTDTDQNKVQIDWQAISDGQQWREDIDTLDAVTVTATEDTTATFTLAWRVVDTGEEGQFTGTLNITEPAADTTPAPFTVDPLTDQPLNQYVEFPPIEVLDIDEGESIAVKVTGTGVQYAVDACAGYGGFTATSTDVQLGDLVKPRILTPDDFETEATGSIAIGSESSSLSATTRAAVLPTLDTPLPDLDLGQGDAVSLDLDEYISGASSYDLSGLPAESGLSFSGSTLSGTTNTDDIEASPFTLTATAYSADGSIQDAFSVTVVDDVGPVISINAITTTNTAPIASGSAGDAVSLTLDLEGVDVTHTSSYNITPDSGTWDQQFPELALGEYTMTLNGEDAVGNPAVERSALLRIVDEIVIEQGGLFRALFKPAARSVNKSLFR